MTKYINESGNLEQTKPTGVNEMEEINANEIRTDKIDPVGLVYSIVCICTGITLLYFAIPLLSFARALPSAISLAIYTVFVMVCIGCIRYGLGEFFVASGSIIQTIIILFLGLVIIGIMAGSVYIIYSLFYIIFSNG